jgi:hypothetical protein
VVFYQNTETNCSRDTLTSSYLTSRRQIPEDSSPHIRRFGVLKIHVRAIIVVSSLPLSLFIFSSSFLIFYYSPFPSSTYTPPSSLSFDHHLSFLKFLVLLFLNFSLVLRFLISQLPIRLCLLYLSYLLHPFLFVLRIHFCVLYFPHLFLSFLIVPNFLFFSGVLTFFFSVVQLVQALRYKPEGRGFDSRLSFEFFVNIILPAALWPWGWISLWQKWVAGIFPGWQRRPGWQPYHLHVRNFLKSGSLNLLEPSGFVQTCKGIALPLPSASLNISSWTGVGE